MWRASVKVCMGACPSNTGAGGCAPRCTTRRRNAHGTEQRELIYPWHPWVGRQVHVHEVIGDRRGSSRSRPLVSGDRQGSQAEQNNRLSRHMQNCAAASACGIASALYMICSRRGVSRAELARRLEWHREQVDRLFRLDHKSRLDQMEAALSWPLG